MDLPEDFTGDLVRAMMDPAVRGIMDDFARVIRGLYDATKDVQQRNYKKLIKDLENEENRNEIHIPLNIPVYSMTPLEYSVWQHDWKMASIFLQAGANPMKNAFDGLMETMASYHGMGDPIMHAGFEHLEEVPDHKDRIIPGFPGLRALLQDDNDDEASTEKMLAYLFLVESSCGIVDYDFHVNVDYPKIRAKVALVVPEKAPELEEKSKLVLFTAREKKLPAEVVSLIAEFFITSFVRSTVIEEVVEQLKLEGENDI